MNMNTDRETSESRQTAEALHEQREWLRVTLSSIGDAVITTDTKGCITFLNPVAQSLTGWTQEGAAGVPLESVFKIVNEETRRPVENPATRALREGVVVGLAKHTLLIAKDGTERPIDDSAAPIRNASGEVAGVVLVFRDITERRRAEQLIQDTLSYAENIIATLREPFIVLDNNLRIKTANRCFYETFRVSPDETENQFIYDLGNRQWDIPKLQTLLEEVLSDNHPVHDFEVEHTFPTIGRKIMLLNACRFVSVDIRLNLILLAIEDITERKEIEAGLEKTRKELEVIKQSADESLEYAESIINTVREPLIALNQDLRVVTASRSFYEVFKVNHEETVGQLIYDLGNKQWDIPKLRELLEDILPQKAAFDNYEVEHDFSTIGRRIMLLNARQIQRGSGKELIILLAIEDITERKQAEAAMEDSELRYRRLFETTHDAILILDAGTKKILDANPFIKDLLGYSQAEFVGKELWQFGLFQDVEESKSAFRELQEEGYIRYENLPLQTKDGRKVEVEFVSNVSQVDHTPIIQCNIRDITERSRLERQTHEQAEALAELHVRKDEFLAMLSHELRNPLSAILNALHVLRLQDTENPIQQKAKIIIERQVGQLAHLIDDLLEVSRVITGRIQLHQERLEMRGIVERAIESARPLIDRCKHELSVSLPAEPIWLQGDPTRLEQVVVNLLNNAAKYTDEGGHIRLTAQQEGGEVVLRVRDTGVGIAPELLPRIFDLFTQADRTLDRSQGGLGIGLSLVQKLVELHGGTVAAQSVGLGQGSEFIVRLPALSPARESIAPIETAKQPAQTSRVLVVDDNVDAADMLVMMLQMFGHEVQAAYSGQTALETAVEYQPDFVLLDIGLPDMNGYEVARRLRQQPQTKDMRLIAMTGYGQDSDRQRSQEAGFDHHLVKPVDPQKLQDLLATQALVSA